MGGAPWSRHLLMASSNWESRPGVLPLRCSHSVSYELLRTDLVSRHAEQRRPQQVVAGGGVGQGGRHSGVAAAIALPQLTHLGCSTREREEPHEEGRFVAAAWRGACVPCVLVYTSAHVDAAALGMPGSPPESRPAGKAMCPGALPEGCTWWRPGGRAVHVSSLGLTRCAGKVVPLPAPPHPSPAPDVGSVDQRQVGEGGPLRAPCAAAQHRQFHAVAPKHCECSSSSVRGQGSDAGRLHSSTCFARLPHMCRPPTIWLLLPAPAGESHALCSV